MEKKSWVLHHDIAPRHTLTVVGGFSLSKLKRQRKEKRFATIDGIKPESKKKPMTKPHLTNASRIRESTDLRALYLREIL